MPKEYELSIITINYNGLNDTCALMESIPFNEKMEVIVVDNASTNDEATVLEQRFPHIKVIRSERNLGFAGGNNIGIKAATGKYIFLVNNDTEFKDFNIQPLVNRLKSASEIAIVCPKIRFAWAPQPIQFAGYTQLSKITIRNHAIGFGEKDKGQHDNAHITPYAHGAAMLIKREAIEHVGLMPECYFLYYEELDWSLKFTRAGYQIWYDPACTIYHKESQSTGQDSALRTYYITRNRLLLVRRNKESFHPLAAYFYLLLLVVPRDLCKSLLKGRLDLTKAVCRALRDFIHQKLTVKM